jgi:hypothetical protein
MMKPGRRQAIVLLTVALALAASTTVASANDGRTVKRLLQATDMSTRDLQTGFHRLKRICEYGANNPPSPDMANDTAIVTTRTRNELRDLGNSLNQVLLEYTNQSHITRDAQCKYLPGIFLIGGVCREFKNDSLKLANAEQVAKQLTQQAQERLDLYDQYWRLERQGCTRPGFARKLWHSEEKSLWPVLINTPTILKSLLQETAENE